MRTVAPQPRKKEGRAARLAALEAGIAGADMAKNGSATKANMLKAGADGTNGLERKTEPHANADIPMQSPNLINGNTSQKNILG